MSETSLPPGADFANFLQQSTQDEHRSNASLGQSQMDDSISPTDIEDSLVPVAYELLRKVCEEFKQVYSEFEKLPTLNDGPNVEDYAVNHREAPLKTRLEIIDRLSIEDLRRKYDSEVLQNAVLQRDLRALQQLETSLKQRLSFAETLLFRQRDVVDKIRSTLEKELQIFNDREQIRIKVCRDLKKENREYLQQIKEYKRRENALERELKNQKKINSDLEKKYTTAAEKNHDLQTERANLQNENDQLRKELIDQKSQLTDSNKSLAAEKNALSNERIETQRLNSELQKHAAKIDQLEKQMQKERENFENELDRGEREQLEKKANEIDSLTRKYREEMNEMKITHAKQLEEFKLASNRALGDAHDENERLRSERDRCIADVNELRQDRKAWENRRMAELMQAYTRKHLEANVEFGRDRAIESAREAQPIYARQSHNPARGYLKDLNCPSAIHSDNDSPFKDQNVPPPLRMNPGPYQRQTTNNVDRQKLKNVIHKVTALDKNSRRPTGRQN